MMYAAPPSLRISIRPSSWATSILTSLSPSVFVSRTSNPGGKPRSPRKESVSFPFHLHPDCSASWFGKGVLERIGDEFIDHKPARDRCIDGDRNILGVNQQGDSLRTSTIGMIKFPGGFADVLTNVYIGKIT